MASLRLVKTFEVSRDLHVRVYASEDKGAHDVINIAQGGALKLLLTIEQAEALSGGLDDALELIYLRQEE